MKTLLAHDYGEVTCQIYFADSILTFVAQTQHYLVTTSLQLSHWRFDYKPQCSTILFRKVNRFSLCLCACVVNKHS